MNKRESFTRTIRREKAAKCAYEKSVLQAKLRYQQHLRNHGTPSQALKAVYKIQALKEQLTKL